MAFEYVADQGRVFEVENEGNLMVDIFTADDFLYLTGLPYEVVSDSEVNPDGSSVISIPMRQCDIAIHEH